MFSSQTSDPMMLHVRASQDHNPFCAKTTEFHETVLLLKRKGSFADKVISLLRTRFLENDIDELPTQAHRQPALILKQWLP
jgi:hypothetical protein